MSGNFKKEDLRIIKTHKALTNSLYILLNNRSFGKITVNDLCEEALTSRATFYAHFNDKYDLLNSWLASLSKEFTNSIDIFALTDKELQIQLNKIILKDMKVILNLLEDANSEILNVLNNFLYSIIKISLEEKELNIISPNHTTLINFCSGGMSNIFLQQCKNKNYKDLPMITDYFCKMLYYIIEWDSKQI